jgi:hypothetical protein
MPQATMDPTNTGFVERRSGLVATPPTVERRQFTNSHQDASPQVRELAVAIDEYKLRHRRRFISYDEIFAVITELGYRKCEA